MKKFLATLLAVVMVLSIFTLGTSAYTAEKLTQEEWDYINKNIFR